MSNDSLAPGQFKLPDGRTLADAVQQLKAQRMTRLLNPPDSRFAEEELSEQVFLFHRAVDRGDQPTIGQTLAGYWYHANQQIDADYVADTEANLPERHFSARRAAVNRIVFRAKAKEV
jgi:hypothetical protein